MKLYFLVPCANQVVDDMGRRGVAARTAKPLLAGKAFDDAVRVVDAAVSSSEESVLRTRSIASFFCLRASMRWKLNLFFLFHARLAVPALYGHASHAFHVVVIVCITFLILFA